MAKQVTKKRALSTDNTAEQPDLKVARTDKLEKGNLFFRKTNTLFLANESWQAQMQTFAEAGARCYGDDQFANVLFVVGKDKEVCLFV